MLRMSAYYACLNLHDKYKETVILIIYVHKADVNI